MPAAMPGAASPGITVLGGDSLAILPTLAPESFDSLLTDPPAAIHFMQAAWDHDHGGRDAWVRDFAAIFGECLRVLKPGAHGLVWALPRTSHWTACALEDAGFEVRDRISHLFGSGFPKSLNVSRAIDKYLGAEREVVGHRTFVQGGGNSLQLRVGARREVTAPITEPATDLAQQWDGWGTALKPAVEDYWLVRKPLIGTVAENVLRYGTGALNIDASRIGTSGGGTDCPHWPAHCRGHGGEWNTHHGAPPAGWPTTSGRWPSNALLSHSDSCVQVGTRRVRGARTRPRSPDPEGGATWNLKRRGGTQVGYSDQDGTEEMPTWNCAPGCPISRIDQQSGNSRSRRSVLTSTPGGIYGNGKGLPSHTGEYGFDDAGGASRYFQVFYCPKPSRKERGEGTDHPTVKPITLMRYLARLITPPGGTVLDAFAGSGSVGLACLADGFSCVLIERDTHYCDIIRSRLTAWKAQP